MRIAIIALGSRGDVQPYVALGKGLLKAGHTVRVSSHQDFKGLIEAHGLEFVSDEINVQSIVQTERMAARGEQGNFLLLMAQMAREAQTRAVQLTEAGLVACQGIDLLLAGVGGLYIGIALAEKLKLPLLQAYVVPFTPTREFSSVLTPRLPRPLNRLSHQLTRQIMWQGFRSADSVARQKVLGLPRAPLGGPYQSSQLKGMPVLYGFSPAVIPPPSDWNAQERVTGFWFLDESESWVPPNALTDFIKNGPAPVYVGFGSMSNRNPEAMAELVIKALALAGQRAVLLSGWGGLDGKDLPDSIIMIDSVPHSWLFRHMAAVVHHGGASTAAAGLRAGIPSVVVPFFGDQPFWGQRIAELGVGPQPIPRKKLTAERLASAIRQAVTDHSMRQRAAKLGTQIQAEDGVGLAVQIINELGQQGLPGAQNIS